MIDSYAFGLIVLDGQKYHNDILILPSRIREWWRREGHKVSLADLSEAIAERPEIVIIGTGAYQGMQVPDDLRQQL